MFKKVNNIIVIIDHKLHEKVRKFPKFVRQYKDKPIPLIKYRKIIDVTQ